MFQSGPDNGPDARIFFGRPSGLVLWRNELTRVFLPGESLGRLNEQGDPIRFDSTSHGGNLQRGPGELGRQLSLPASVAAQDLRLSSGASDPRRNCNCLGVGELESPLHVHAQVNFLHFPPLFHAFHGQNHQRGGSRGDGITT